MPKLIPSHVLQLPTVRCSRRATSGRGIWRGRNQELDDDLLRDGVVVLYYVMVISRDELNCARA
jgi:hypothetical protein